MWVPVVPPGAAGPGGRLPEHPPQPALDRQQPLHRLDRPLLFQIHAPEGHEAVPAMEYVLMVVATVSGRPAAMGLAWFLYGADPAWARPKAFVKRFPELFEWVNAKYDVDEFYEAAFIGPCKQLGAQLWAFDSLGGGRHGQRRGPVHPDPEPRRPLVRRQDRGRPGEPGGLGPAAGRPGLPQASRAAGCRTTPSSCSSASSSSPSGSSWPEFPYCPVRPLDLAGVPMIPW